MSHKLTLELPDEAYESLVQAGQEKGESPETVASQVLTIRFTDPLVKLFGALEYVRDDISERHDEYIGKGILDEPDRD
jgi:hypothetical protein